MIEVSPLKGRAALLTDEPAAAGAALRAGLRLAAEVTVGGAAGLEPGRPVLWLFVGPPERAWAAAEAARRRGPRGTRGKGGSIAR